MSESSKHLSDHEHVTADRRLKANGKIKEIRAVAHLLGPYRGQTILAIGATPLWSVLVLLPALLIKILIDEGIGEDNKTASALVAAASAALALAMWGLMFIEKNYLYLIAYRAVVSLQKLLFSHLVRLLTSYHETHPVGTTVAKLTTDVYAARGPITIGLPTMITSTVTVVGSLALMFLLDWDMALITLLVLPVLVLISWIYRKWVASLFKQMREAIGAVANSANETLGVVGLIQSYNQEHRHISRFAEATATSRSTEYRTILAGAIYFPATSILSATASGLLIIYGGVQVIRGNSEVGTMVAFFGYLQMFLGPIAGFSSIQQTYQSGVAALDNVFAVIDEEITSADRSTSPALGCGSIVLDDVSLDANGRRVLDGLQVDLPYGAVVAFVGDGSSGRGEIARVIAGLDAPSAGRVLYDGVDGAEISPGTLFDWLGYMSPQTGLLLGSVRENLVLGGSGHSDEQLLAALAQMYGVSFLDRLPRGLDTEVGRDGRNLPAGVRQALVIARAVLRRPQCVVLDGAVDSLDAVALARFAGSRESILAGVTIVAATNQPLIAEYADRVIVLDGGRIIEQGPPDDLLRAGGPFADLSRSWRSGLSLSSSPGDRSTHSWAERVPERRPAARACCTGPSAAILAPWRHEGAAAETPPGWQQAYSRWWRSPSISSTTSPRTRATRLSTGPTSANSTNP